MIIHRTCPDCGTDLGCQKSILLFQHSLAEDEDGNLWCPFCFIHEKLGGAKVKELMLDLYCRDCAGEAGTTVLRLTCESLNAVLRTNVLGGTTFRYYPTITDMLGHNWVEQTYQRTTRRTPTPATVDVMLPAGSIPCRCNNCERLRIGFSPAPGA